MQNGRESCHMDESRGIIKLEGVNSSTTDTITITFKTTSIHQLSEQLCFRATASDSTFQAVVGGTLRALVSGTKTIQSTTASLALCIRTSNYNIIKAIYRLGI